MRGRIFLLGICLGLMACSTTAPPDDRAGATDGAVSQASTGAPPTDEQGPVAATDADVIPVTQVPAVPQSDYVGEEAEVVCQWVRPTGSHRKKRICRTRAEIERASINGKEAFDEMHRSQQNGAGN